MKKLVLTILLSAIFGFSYAQETNTPTDTLTLEKISAEVAAIKKEQSAWEKFLSGLPKISGFMQVGYEWNDGGVSTFFIKRARLNFAGGIVRNLSYRMQLEFAGSPKIVDLYLEYKPFNQLNFLLGETLVPFLIENPEYVPLKSEFIDMPLALRKLMAVDKDISGMQSSGRDMGLFASGGFFKREGYSILNYNIAVLNGEGINIKDGNKSKDILTTLRIKPVSGLQIAGSYFRGEFGANHIKRIRYGAGASYNDGPYMVRGEYIVGKTGEQKSSGWFAVAGYRATKTLMPALRYDTFKEDTSFSSSRQTNYTASIVWQPVKALRCQLNYTYEDYAKNHIAGRDRNVVVVMLSGIF